jgi:hypothetical protein
LRGHFFPVADESWGDSAAIAMAANRGCVDDRHAMPVRTQGEVRRLYRSSWHWYKALLVTEGVWDHVYYNTQTQSLVCGEQAWQQYMSGSGEQIMFDELVPKL